MNMSKSVWVEMQEQVVKIVNDHMVYGTEVVDDLADDIARKICEVLDMPDEVQDTDYEKWMEARKVLTEHMNKKEAIGLLKQECKELDNERSKLIVQLENAVGYENIKPIVDSLHDNRRLVTENLEAIKNAES
jgi:hypothetical protein